MYCICPPAQQVWTVEEDDEQPDGISTGVGKLLSRLGQWLVDCPKGRYLGTVVSR
jgi:hypothetical protein